MISQREAWFLCFVYMVLGIIIGYTVWGGTPKQEKPATSEVEKLEIVNDNAFSQVAEYRGWTETSNIVGSLSIQHFIKDESGQVRIVNALTIRDPFDEYRTLILRAER